MCSARDQACPTMAPPADGPPAADADVWCDYTHALVRGLPSSLLDALTMHLPAMPIDVGAAHAQHDAYNALLRTLVPTVVEVPADEGCPDCVFIEDTLLAIGPCLVATQPGAPERRPEVAPVSEAARKLLAGLGGGRGRWGAYSPGVKRSVGPRWRQFSEAARKLLAGLVSEWNACLLPACLLSAACLPPACLPPASCLPAACLPPASCLPACLLACLPACLPNRGGGGTWDALLLSTCEQRPEVAPPPGHALSLTSLTGSALLDGGDVMFDGSCVWCGVSARSNAEAAAALGEVLAPAGIPVAPIPVTDPHGATLHLKSIVSALASHHILVADSDAGRAMVAAARASPVLRAGWAAAGVADIRVTYIPDALCANVLRIGRHVVMQKGFPASESVIRPLCDELGLTLHTLNMSELAKADGDGHGMIGGEGETRALMAFWAETLRNRPPGEDIVEMKV
ncbi:hypothetical protein FOA52_014680 [Chlamydomonas sp. UWO 241]|nr:hypothetical protein FOA52_014680 [Chlamydomonas sp. UWO 241]